MLINISKWSKRLNLTVRDVACLSNSIDPDFAVITSSLFTVDIAQLLAETEEDIIAFIGSDAKKNDYMVSRETISAYFEYMETTCPDVLKLENKLNNILDTSDGNRITKNKSELNAKKEKIQNPTSKKQSIIDKRINCINKQLQLLEQAAEAKNIPFDRRNLNCSKEQILEWLNNKNSILFKKIGMASFEKAWKRTEYALCHHSHTDKDFFKNIQGY